MTRAPDAEPPPTAPAVDVEAYVALLQREQELQAMQRTLGWRVLSHYGPYKRRFVLPAWERIRRILARWSGPRAPTPSPYARWAEMAERVHAAMPPPTATPQGMTMVSVLLVCDPASEHRVGPLLSSLVAQRCDAWELLLVRKGDAAAPRTDDAWSPGSDDSRVHVDPAWYGDRATAAAAALGRARGALVTIVDAGVRFAPDALGVVGRAFEDTACDVLYSDEDHSEGGVRSEPRFSPGWSPDLLLSRMYWSRAVFYRRALLARLLPLLDGGEALSYGLALRATEERPTVVHVPRILAHVEADRPSEASDAERRALERALARRGIAARVEPAGPRTYRVRREIAAPGAVSIIIPTRDGGALLERCLGAVARLDRGDVEVVIVDNGSRSDSTLALLAATSHTVVRAPGPFNFSRLNNLAVRHASGRYLLFLNDDTEPCGTEWLGALEEHAQRPEVGAVGAKLLYSDGRIQHAGIAVGIGGLAGHPYRFRRDAPNEIRDVSAVTAACLMMRREVFDVVGGFDERLPVNSNDVDLCLRLGARGYSIVYTPHAVLHHHESQTRGARARPDDAWLMTRRWRHVLRGDPYYNPNLVLRDESGEPDLEKPDGLVCVYDGTAAEDATLEVRGGDSAGQRVLVTAADLTAVVLRATVAGPDPDGAIRVGVRASPAATADVRVAARSVVGRSADERWFCFAPIPDSADRFWYLRIEVAPGHVVTLGHQPVASDALGPCDENGVPAHGTLRLALYARAPYRRAIAP